MGNEITVVVEVEFQRWPRLAQFEWKEGEGMFEEYFSLFSILSRINA